VRPRLDENLPVVYADTSLFCRVDETLTWIGLYKLLDFLGSSLRIVSEVERELRGHAAGKFPGLNRMQNTPLQGEFLRVPAETLSPAQVRQVIQIALLWPATPGAGPREHFGEVATVLVATQHGTPVIIDDGHGQRFARFRGLTVYTTQDVAIAMTRADALTADEGAQLWTAVFAGSGGLEAFQAALADADTG
jgi:hypothetical protein